MTNENETGAPKGGADTPGPETPDTPKDAPEEGAKSKIDPDAVRKALEANLDSDPALLRRIFEQRTKTGADAMSGEEVIPRSYAEFIMDHTVCAPGVFPKDFKLKIRSLTSGEELTVMEGVGDPMSLAITFAKAAIFSLNGTEITDSDHRDFLWEAIGSGGRQVVQNMFAQTGFAPQRALAKAIASTTIS